MILKQMLLLSCCVTGFIQGDHNLDKVQKDFLLSCSLQQGKYNQTVVGAFSQLNLLNESNFLVKNYEDALGIQKLYNEPICSEQIKNGQLLLTARLYELFFMKAVESINAQVGQIVAAQYYWNRVLSEDSLAYLCKHPGFLMHKKTTREKIKNCITLLESTKDTMIHLLGICLHGKYQLQKTESLSFLEHRMKLAFEPLCVLIDAKEFVSALDCYQKLSRMCDSLQEKQDDVEKILKTHGVPRHIDRYKQVYYAVAVVGAATLAAWYYHKEDMIEYNEKSKQAVIGFWQDFLMGPLKGLKKAVWDRHELGLEKFDLDDIPSTVWSCYSPERTLKYTLKTLLHDVNKGIDVAEEIVKRQRINYYLSAIMPIVAGMYGLYRQGRYFYNHESYFKPIRMILREIDIECTKLASENSNISFFDHGTLFFWVSQLRGYLSCLQDQDRTMIEYDMQELISFDFTMAQKQKVVDRMYRTYSFLK